MRPPTSPLPFVTNPGLTSPADLSHAPVVLNRFVRIAVAVLGCLHLCGGHWGVMQVVAWSNMIVDYSAQDGLIEGAKKTFDGEHPCCMCKAIEEGKKQESQNRGDDSSPTASQGLVLKECTFERSIDLPAPRGRDLLILSGPELDLRGDARGTSPPLPPPRVLA
jgi:hypothetical protein